MMAFRRPSSSKDYLARAKLRLLDQNTEGSRGAVNKIVRGCDVLIILLQVIVSLAMLLAPSYGIDHR